MQLIHHNLFITLLLESKAETVFNNHVISKQKCIDYTENLYRPFMVIFLYNLYILGIHILTVLYAKPCYNEQCYLKCLCVHFRLLHVH